MSVLVKDFKMPENCIKCPMQFGGFCYVAPPEIDERVASTVDEAWEQGKPEWCPLVEVAQPDVTDTNVGDTISRQAVLQRLTDIAYNSCKTEGQAQVIDWAKTLVCVMPSAQPERTCVNCGRTANNGGWYADGGTRCPIEEHYALPKDGYCHLWEKRNVTDDDYPERREE